MIIKTVILVAVLACLPVILTKCPWDPRFDRSPWDPRVTPKNADEQK